MVRRTNATGARRTLLRGKGLRDWMHNTAACVIAGLGATTIAPFSLSRAQEADAPTAPVEATVEPTGDADGDAPTPADTGSAEPIEVRDGVERFDPEFFALYNPVTARDMVQRVPGFSIEGGGGGGFGDDNRRGFAANATNVLINGERPSSKTDIEDQLGRISAGNVSHLELIRGAGLADVDVRGQTQIVNVVLLEGASLGATTTYIAELRYVSQASRVGHELQLNRAFQVRGADVSLNVRLPSDQEYGSQTETVTALSGDVVEVRREFNQRDRYPLELAGTLSMQPTDRDAVNFTGQFNTWYHQQDFFSDIFNGDGDRTDIEVRVTDLTDTYDGEVGGDWERQLTDTTSVKLLGLVTQRNEVNTTRERTFATDAVTFDDLAFNSAQTLETSRLSGERIARGTWTWRPNTAHTIEIGGETAFNYLDSAFRIDRFDEDDVLIPVLDDDGDPIDEPFVGDEVRVEELRGEAFIADVWSVTPKLTLETGFVFEASRISQLRVGAAPFERELTFPKPRVTATYTLDSGDQFRFVVNRDVGQLNFQDFATSVNLGDNRTEAGNPDLEPEQAWKTSAQWERRFGQRGALTIEAFYDQYTDKQDRVSVPVQLFVRDPFTGSFLTDPDGNLIPIPIDLDDPATFGVSDGAGNLGDATKVGVRVDATIPLDFIRVANSELRLRGTYQDSQVEDGLTGETRHFSGDNEWDYNIDFRQDIPSWDLAWGAGYNRDGIREIFRANEIHRFGNIDGFLTVFVETTKIPGVTVRLQVDNANDSQFIRDRSIWRPGGIDNPGDFDRRDLTPPDFVERREREMSPVYKLRVSGSF